MRENDLFAAQTTSTEPLWLKASHITSIAHSRSRKQTLVESEQSSDHPSLSTQYSHIITPLAALQSNKPFKRMCS